MKFSRINLFYPRLHKNTKCVQYSELSINSPDFKAFSEKWISERCKINVGSDDKVFTVLDSRLLQRFYQLYLHAAWCFMCKIGLNAEIWFQSGSFQRDSFKVFHFATKKKTWRRCLNDKWRKNPSEFRS